MRFALGVAVGAAVTVAILYVLISRINVLELAP
jgi:hypothetical protein